METLCANPDILKKVAEVRNLTKAEKKRLAMATREKQLHLLGMKTNEKGQVTVNVNPLEEIEKLKEETGLYCFICREGYTYQPTKVLGIYTYSKRVVLEELETKSRKQIGYSTVTHFNIIHVDCHISAIRLARGRDEWYDVFLISVTFLTMPFILKKSGKVRVYRILTQNAMEFFPYGER